MRGKIRDLFPYGSHTVVSLELDESAAGLEEFKAIELEIQFKRYREHRSRDANSYFHVLADKLRQKLNMTMAEVKNHLISSYGQIEYLDDEKPAVIKTNIEPEKMMQNEFLHTQLVRIDDQGCYFYRIYRGSHTYNTAEMSKLIDGTVEECKAQGIETMTPDEIARMVQQWGKYEVH